MPIPRYPLWLKAGAVWIAVVAFLLPMGCTTLSADHRGTPEASSSALLDIYHGPLNHLLAVRRGECPMHPSCSEFARQAMDKHGPVKGWLMATDRLMRCGRDEIRLAPKIQVNGRVKYYDPVDGNDFWWVQKRPGGNPPSGSIYEF